MADVPGDDSLQSRLAVITSRVDRLVRGQRRLQLLCALVVMAIIVAQVYVVAQKRHSSIYHKSIIVTDSQGHPLIDLSIHKDDTYGISLWATNGKALGSMQVRDGRPVLALYDRNQKSRIGMELGSPTGEPGIILFDARGTSRAVLLLEDDDTPGLVFYDKNGVSRMLLGLDINDYPSLSVFDGSGQIRSSFYLTAEGVPAMHFFKGYGKEERMFLWSEDDDSRGSFVLTPEGSE